MTINAALFSFVKVSDNSIVASVRIARFLRDLLGIPLYEKDSAIPNGLDVLLIVNGAYAFAGSDTLSMLGRAIETAKRVVWIQQDYTIIPPKDESGAESPFRKAFRTRHDRGEAPIDYWTTCEPYSRAGRAPTGHICGPGSSYVNWNVLTFNDDICYPVKDGTTQLKSLTDRVQPDTMIYYGSYRKDRSSYFTRYLKSPKVKTTISCPTNRFINDGYIHDNIKHADRLEDFAQLSEYGLGLYLEDKRSHKEFHSPANRFYEMLSAGLGMVFQPESMRMMSRAGIEVGDFVLWNADEAHELMERAQKIADSQHDLWWDNAYLERKSLPERVLEMWDRYTR